MVVKVFCIEEFENEHEWNQFKELYDVIYEKYANTDENIYILSNFRLAKVQIDVLILTEKGIAIIDLKSYKGKVIGNENGNWVVIKNEEEISLPKNLFGQLKEQKFDLLEKLNQIRIVNFEHIEEEKLGRIKCWGYFEKGSNYNITQIGERARTWFDVVTADYLIDKMKRINARYKLRMKDMDAIVKGLNLKEYQIGKKSPVKSAFESNYEKELSVFIQPNNWDEILRKISESNIITIVGEPRVGKSTSIINVANKLKNDGYKIQDDKKSLIELFNSRDDKKSKLFFKLINDRNVFIIDDVFGAIEYEPALVNKWVPLIIKILKYPDVNSKFIFSSRTDIFDKFQRSNNELSYEGLKDEFNECIVKLNFSNYDRGLLKGILSENLEYIQLNEDKKFIVIDNTEKIINELVLPGEIWHFLENAKYDEFQEDSINKSIVKAKRQVIFIKEEIKYLDEYEKLFLHILYINQDFEVDDLEEIYSHCLPLGASNLHYFEKCVDKFRHRFIRIKIEKGFYIKLNNDDTFEFTEEKEKLEFIHPIYIEAIGKLIEADGDERSVLEKIVEKLFQSTRISSIKNWEFDSITGSNKYNHLRYNLFGLILKHYDFFNQCTKDLVIEILLSLSFDIPEIDIYSPKLEVDFDYISWVADNSSVSFVSKLFYMYDTLDIYMKEYVNRLFKNPNSCQVITYCFAYSLNAETVQRFQDKLKELSISDDEVQFLVAKCIIKKYEYLNKINRKLLCGIEINIPLIKCLIYNYEKLSTYLKKILMQQIEVADDSELIETGVCFLINYSFLPPEIKMKYDFMFNLNDKIINFQVGKAFDSWFAATFSEVNYDPKYKIVDNKVLDLYCKWLTNEKSYYPYKELVGFYYGFDLIGYLESSILDFDRMNLKVPKWTESSFSNLKDAIEKNLIIFLDSFPPEESKAYLYSTGFMFYSWSENKELIEKISDIVYEKKEIIQLFLETCLFHFHDVQTKKYPLKIKDSQIKILEELSIHNSLEIKNKAKESLDYIDKLIDCGVYK
ncbi:MAG: hypothetical protein HF976_01605 [ANME-2 cluster archaeon]|nr:hypothetical protein [ANME-2 cluster archaeon]